MYDVKSCKQILLITELRLSRASQFFSGILITSDNKAEIFIPSTKEIYMIESIPGSPRFLHTLTDNLICGGLYPGSSDNCLELSRNGEGWLEYLGNANKLKKQRKAHSSWSSRNGIVLLGGIGSGQTTERLTSSGSINSFRLIDNTR